MNVLVESLRRLYKQNKITEEKVNELKYKGSINNDEYKYIIGKEE